MLCFAKRPTIVTFLFIFTLFSTSSFSNDRMDNSKYVVKILSKELWHKGIKEEDQSHRKKFREEKKNTIYFPEELEVALRLLGS
mgnify:CR=1 FL=1